MNPLRIIPTDRHLLIKKITITQNDIWLTTLFAILNNICLNNRHQSALNWERANRKMRKSWFWLAMYISLWEDQKYLLFGFCPPYSSPCSTPMIHTRYSKNTRILQFRHKSAFCCIKGGVILEWILKVAGNLKGFQLYLGDPIRGKESDREASNWYSRDWGTIRGIAVAVDNALCILMKQRKSIVVSVVSKTENSGESRNSTNINE